jgi:hypothetical protein
MFPVLQTALLSHLALVHGWVPDPVNTNVATKEFDTAVGPKKASIWARTLHSSGKVYLTADYQSEGRNMAESCWREVPAECDDIELAAHARAHQDQVVQSVNQTYARGLHLRHSASA